MGFWGFGVLGVGSIGVTDDFFKIGGNSILALHIVHRMNKLLGTAINIADIFRLKSITKILSTCTLDENKTFNLIKPYYQKYNNRLNDLIFIHPANAGTEIYQNLSDKLASKFTQ